MLVILLVSTAFLGSLTACTSASHSGPDPETSFVARIEGPVAALAAPDGALEWVRLESESPPGQGILFARFRSATAARRAGGELYRTVARVQAERVVSIPRVAVYAEWQLQDLSARPAFEQNRAALFHRRTRAIPGFYADWLLERPDQPGRYLILGLYADAVAREQARTHPEIRAFAAAHPLAVYGAQDVYGVRNARVLELCTAARGLPRLTSPNTACRR